MKFTKEQIQELIEYLQGSCNSLYKGIIDVLGDYSEDDLSAKNLEQIDEEIFLCETCGWWLETCEMTENEDNNCTECNND